MVVPCSKPPYEERRRFRLIFSYLGPWLHSGYLDLYVVDHLRDPSSGVILGLIPWEERDKVLGQDDYPAWSRLKQILPELTLSLKKKLMELRSYDEVYALLDVKAYDIAFRRAARELQLSVRYLNAPVRARDPHHNPISFVKGLKKLRERLRTWK